MSKEMSIWNHASKTDPSGTKTARLDGRDVTSINGIYMVQKATELWGPVGGNWGYEIKEERFDEAGLMMFKEQPAGNAIMHTIKASVWYKNEAGERCEVEHFGHTKYVYLSKYGPITDFDAPKKSLTDAIKKCLSMLGFCADIFLGMFDDQNYVNAQKTKEAIEKADDADAELTAQRLEFEEWVERETEAYKLIPSISAMGAVYSGHCGKAERQCKALGIDFSIVKSRFDAAYFERKAQLENGRAA